jgi:hypothetical protein
MKQLRFSKFFLLCIFFSFIKINLNAQMNTDSISVMNKLVALRNDFIGRIEAMGYHPGLKPPEIIMDNPPSFGNYDDSTNIVRTSNWNTLSDPDKQFLSGPGNYMAIPEKHILNPVPIDGYSFMNWGICGVPVSTRSLILIPVKWQLTG